LTVLARAFCFFFFQAEDGIRDFHVTGVQTWLFRSIVSPTTRRHDAAAARRRRAPRRRRTEGDRPGCERGDGWPPDSLRRERRRSGRRRARAISAERRTYACHAPERRREGG